MDIFKWIQYKSGLHSNYLIYGVLYFSGYGSVRAIPDECGCFKILYFLFYRYNIHSTEDLRPKYPTDRKVRRVHYLLENL